MKNISKIVLGTVVTSFVTGGIIYLVRLCKKAKTYAVQDKALFENKKRPFSDFMNVPDSYDFDSSFYNEDVESFFGGTPFTSDTSCSGFSDDFDDTDYDDDFDDTDYDDDFDDTDYDDDFDDDEDCFEDDSIFCVDDEDEDMHLISDYEEFTFDDEDISD